MKRKPGIFDPWRQAPAPSLDVEPTPDTGEPNQPTRVPTRFAGKNAGVVVWLQNSSLVTENAKENLVGALDHLCKDPSLVALMQRTKIGPHVDRSQLFTQLRNASNQSVNVQGSYPEAMRAVALFLRQAVRQKPALKTYLDNLGIHPYVS
ncbi:MAG: hypothetical protein H0U59_03280 [Gemmatimonadaceae bacterium]|nr:hypothetical protein [Gemmatimonadaceae bacterium]